VAVLQQKTAEQGGQASKSSRSANIPLDSNVGNTTPSALYSHGFVMQLKGDYKSTIKYFERLSALPWRFHWDELRYEVGDYPSAIITLEVHTVSMAEEWIGV
jgi:MSHA biogenesis protein MshJ